MKKLNGVIFFICLLILGGIAEGLSDGLPLSTALWSIPIMLVMWVSGRVTD